MTKPFFSIVIPTKNRPDLLHDAISSVVLQNFDDYELIISDNFNDERTKKVIDDFRSNKHVNYIRTEKELSMPDHWEWALKQATGRYMLILTDRAFLRQDALRDIHNTISTSKEDIAVCFWRYGYFDEEKDILLDEKRESDTKILKAVDIANNFSRTLDTRYLPRPHVGCYRHDIAEKIRSEQGRLCMDVAPDNTAALFFLAYCDIIMYIPRPLVLFQGAKVSNVTKERLNPWPFFNSLNIKNPYRFVPIKAPIASSLNFNDLLTIKNLAGGNLRDINVDWTFYFVICYEELMGKMMIPGADKKIQAELLKEWRKTLSSLDKKMQASVWKEIRRRYVNILKSYLKESFLGSFLVGIKRFLLRKPTLKFQNALAAGGFNAVDINKLEPQ